MKRFPIFLALLAFGLALPGYAAEAFDRDQLRAAIEEQQSLISDSPSDSGLWNDLGNLLRLADRHVEARDAYTKAIDLAPENDDAYFNLGLLLQETGFFEDATTAYRSVLALEPDDAWTHYQLGAVAEQTRRRQDAIAHYARAFELDPYLAFADVNPQVVRSKLVTEAMMARRRTQKAVRVPRIYSDGARISALLVPPVEDLRSAEAGPPADSVDDPGQEGIDVEALPAKALEPLQGRPLTERGGRRTPSKRSVIRE